MNNKVYILIILFLLITITLMIFSNDKLYKKLFFNNANLKMNPNYREKKYVYIDLGANTGNSIYNFLGINEREGGNGKLSALIDKNIVKINKWEIYGIEADPVFDKSLLAMKSDIESWNKNITINLYTSTIAWT